MHSKKRLIRISMCVAIAAALIWTSVPAFASPFTDKDLFFGALTTASTTLNFDIKAAGTTIGTGTPFEGIIFNYDDTYLDFVVTDGNEYGGTLPAPTTSGLNMLGTTDTDVLYDGYDDFDLSFGAASAIGMYFITADLMFDDDIILSAGTESVGLDASLGVLLSDGSSYAYFLGIVDYASVFTSASITTVGGDYFTYNVDDITTAAPVPEPGTILLLGTGLLGIFGFIRRRRHS